MFELQFVDTNNEEEKTHIHCDKCLCHFCGLCKYRRHIIDSIGFLKQKQLNVALIPKLEDKRTVSQKKKTFKLSKCR